MEDTIIELGQRHDWEGLEGGFGGWFWNGDPLYGMEIKRCPTEKE
jgi:hypothetical protein